MAQRPARSPRGLRFTTKHRRLTTAISLAGLPKHTLTLRRNKLTITISYTATVIRLTIRPPGLIESHRLQAGAQKIANYNRKRTHHKKKALRLTLVARILDTGHKTTSLRIALAFR